MKCWMIRKKGTELYSTCGSVPHFVKRGKVFYRYVDLTKHLRYFAKYKDWEDVKASNYTQFGLPTDVNKNPYRDCEIVEFDLSVSQIKDISVELNLLSL